MLVCDDKYDHDSISSDLLYFQMNVIRIEISFNADHFSFYNSYSTGRDL